MSTFNVKIEIPVEASTPQDAANEALRLVGVSAFVRTGQALGRDRYDARCEVEGHGQFALAVEVPSGMDIAVVAKSLGRKS